MKSSSQSIEALIEIKRKEMVETAIKTGFTSEMTLKQSKELDFLLNLFQKKYFSDCFGTKVKID
jgi:Spo0E like sporulation regulatory protein